MLFSMARSVIYIEPKVLQYIILFYHVLACGILSALKKFRMHRRRGQEDELRDHALQETD